MYTTITLISVFMLAAILAVPLVRKRRRNEWVGYSRKKLVVAKKRLWPSRDNRKWWLDKIAVFRYPAVERWVFLPYAVSFGILLFSGFFSALFLDEGLHGYLLLFHVAAGGVFAPTLAGVIVLRARAYNPFNLIQPKDNRVGTGGQNKTPKASLVINGWILAFSGLLLIASALAMMLSFFSIRDNAFFAGLHRGAALVSLLSLILYVYQVIQVPDAGVGKDT